MGMFLRILRNQKYEKSRNLHIIEKCCIHPYLIKRIFASEASSEQLPEGLISTLLKANISTITENWDRNIRWVSKSAKQNPLKYSTWSRNPRDFSILYSSFAALQKVIMNIRLRGAVACHSTHCTIYPKIPLEFEFSRLK